MVYEAYATEEEVRPEVSRGGCLTAFLVFMIIANAGSALLYLSSPEAVTMHLPRMSTGLVLLMGACSLLNIVLAILVWRWRKVGFYGFVGVALLVFPLNLWAGIPVPQAVSGLVGPLLLGLLVRPRWSRFT